jgi:hypothetical protein
MRKFILIALLFTSVPASAQDIGQRTQSAEQLLVQMRGRSADEDLATSIEAANAHPLGTLANPVRVGGPEGERSYIARLRCGDGSTPRLGARSEGGVGAFGTVVGSYPLDCGAAAPGRTTLMFDMYHAEHAESRPPAGFTIAPR